jgi:hypothetical protein
LSIITNGHTWGYDSTKWGYNLLISGISGRICVNVLAGEPWMYLLKHPTNHRVKAVQAQKVLVSFFGFQLLFLGGYHEP